MLSITLRNVLKKSFGKRFYCGIILDPKQEVALKEECYLVDECDNIIGRASKKDCHLVKNNNVLLHRAFSVFLFDKMGHLVLQKRSSEKITYPDCYTNSCCSHPIADIDGEDEQLNAIGIKRAARRRLNYELGIPLEQLPLEKFNYITRVHYKDLGNGKWGEHEIDYVLFLQGNVQIKPNPNEISEVSYVPRKDVDSFIPQLNSPLTPWFSLILKHRLKHWWDHLDAIHEITDHQNILKLSECQI